MSERVTGLPIDWDRLTDGVEVADATAADQLVPFNVIVPAFATPETTSRIMVSDPDKIRDESMRTVVFILDLPEHGRVVVNQKVAPYDMRSLEAVAKNNEVRPGEPDNYRMVPLRGTEALLVAARGLGRLMWIERGVLFDMTGPSVSESAVQELAEAL